MPADQPTGIADRARQRGAAAPGDAARLAIFVPSMGGGGAERVMVTLANGFAARGHPVDLVLASATGPCLADVGGDVRVVDLAAGRVLPAIPALARYLRRERPAAMLAALSHANLAAILARMAARTQTRLVVSERASLAGVKATYTGAYHRAIRLGMRLLYGRADAVIAVSQAMAREVVAHTGLPPARVHAIYNPVVTPALLRMVEAPADHPWLTGERTVPVVLAVGRLSHEKNLPLLLEAFARLRRGRPARLLLLGEGPDRPALEALAERLGIAADVDFAGFATNPFPAMRAADLYVMSSRFEGLPNALVQAMACGARLISTDCPTGPAEILDNGRWGRLVPPDDVAAMAGAMAAALDDPTPPDTRARAEAFRADTIIDEYLAVLLDKDG